MELETIENHYRDPEFREFYKSVYGTDGYNVGLYMSNKINNLSPEIIHHSINKKWDLLFFFIRNYLNVKYHYLSIVDFGSGNGGTMRKLYDELKNIRKQNNVERESDYLLYSYDISRENTTECNLNNFEQKIPVRIYNRNFLDTLFDDGSVNLVISEETFHQVADKIALIREITRILSRINGFLIFSDIFLREDLDDNTRESVSSQLNLSTLQKFSEFSNLAEENGLKYCNSILYTDDLKIHYSNLLNITDTPDKVRTHLENWRICADNLDIGLFVFKKC